MTKPCPCTAQYRFALKLSRDGGIVFKRMGNGKIGHVLLDWCERCGRVQVGHGTTALRLYYPVARVIQDLVAPDPNLFKRNERGPARARKRSR